MRNNINKYKAYTLIEVIIWITIFSIMMISIISIYVIANNTSVKADINRSMQENLKSLVTEISEDIINTWIKWTTDSTILDDCDFSYTPWTTYKKWEILCLGSQNNYFLARKNLITWVFERTTREFCEDINSECYIAKNWIYTEDIQPLTNNLVTIKNINFLLTTSFWINKVTLIMTLQPSVKSWIKGNLIRENKIIFQTTISERPLLTNN